MLRVQHRASYERLIHIASSILTIIIPHYNIPSLLKRLLDTIPVRDDIQTIVVDDRSTELLDEYEALKQEYPHVIFAYNDRPANGGGAARNVGLELAEGKWLLFADADDIFADGFYAAVSVWFDSDVDVVFFPPISIYADSGKDYEPISLYREYIENFQKTGSKKDENILRYMWHTPWSRLIRKETVVANRLFFSETPRSNDMYFAVAVSYYAKEVAVSEKNIYVNIIKGSISQGIPSRPPPSKEIAMSFVDERIGKYCFLRDRLSENDFLALPIHGIMIIAYILLDSTPPYSRFSFKNVPLAIEAYKKCHKSGVKLFHKGFFSPNYLWKMFFKWCRRKKNMKNLNYYA